jgi:hypothetical protein
MISTCGRRDWEGGKVKYERDRRWRKNGGARGVSGNVGTSLFKPRFQGDGAHRGIMVVTRNVTGSLTRTNGLSVPHVE